MAFTVTITSTALVPPLCKVLNPEVLLSTADQRGQDRLIPGADGVLPNLRRNTVTRRTLQLVVLGASPTTVVANVVTLRGLATPTGTGTGTRTVTLTLPDSSTLTAAAHVGPLEVGPLNARNVRATLDLSLPEGVFT